MKTTIINDIMIIFFNYEILPLSACVQQLCIGYFWLVLAGTELRLCG